MTHLFDYKEQKRAMHHCFPLSDNSNQANDTCKVVQKFPTHGIYQVTTASKQAGWSYRKITFHIPPSTVTVTGMQLMLEAPTSALCTLSTLHNSSWPSWDYEMTQTDTGAHVRQRNWHKKKCETPSVNLGDIWCCMTAVAKTVFLITCSPLSNERQLIHCINKLQTSVVTVA